MGEIKLNQAQQAAVDQIYGPVLVLAGPGTGKTQLLSARIANILTKTDTNASNILCLTFTDSAAHNMLERLKTIIGKQAYEVHIATYHSFGSDIIRTYPEYFGNIDLESGKDSRKERPIDQLGQLQIINEIVNSLDYSNPLYGARHHVRHIVSAISELKRGLYTPNGIKQIAQQNLKQSQSLSPKIAKALAKMGRMPTKAEQAIKLFSKVENMLKDQPGLAEIAHNELQVAISEAQEYNSTKTITAWKNSWLTKDEHDRYRFSNEEQQLRMLELANIYAQYNLKLAESNQYDYDDMILDTISALKDQDELRFNLQEKYQFILLDEFQDTNSAQFELVKQLAENPVNEGQPNVFSVGDDDQAIYAFQGAESSNMYQFTKVFEPVTVINLAENYRSHHDLIQTASKVAEQIESRLHLKLANISKSLIAKAKNLPNTAQIERHDLESQANEYAWVANKINELVTSGTDPANIAVLAPRHRYLEEMVPFLTKLNLPVSYEKRENILQTKLAQTYLLMTELCLAINQNQTKKINELMAQVLSLDFYQIPVDIIWKLNWKSSNSHESKWTELALNEPLLADHVKFFLKQGLNLKQTPLEYLLDYFTGSQEVKFDQNNSYKSPLKDFYFSRKQANQMEFFQSIANLSVIREHLRARQRSSQDILTAQDLVNFFEAYELAEQPLINSHPIATAESAVQLQTVYKAKGLEYQYVFLLSVHEDIWGTKARSDANKIKLPANLKHIRYQGSSEDELLRILYVAITRAKQGLYLTSHRYKDSGKQNEPLKYLNEITTGDKRLTQILPKTNQQVKLTKYDASQVMEQIETLWHNRHLKLDAQLKTLLKSRLDNYKMSPTHLNTITDEEYGGWEQFLFKTLLRFPQAPSETGEYGNAIHKALETYQRQLAKGDKPEIASLLKQYEHYLSQRYIAREDFNKYLKRGRLALKSFINARQEMFTKKAEVEVDFRSQAVTLGEALLTGKIDRLEIDEDNKTVNIVDFKTGRAEHKWATSSKLKKYKQQLYFYKILIEGSQQWSKYRVAEARLEFVEPNTHGKTAQPLILKYNSKEETELKNEIKQIWQKIIYLDFI